MDKYEKVVSVHYQTLSLRSMWDDDPTLSVQYPDFGDFIKTRLK